MCTPLKKNIRNLIEDKESKLIQSGKSERDISFNDTIRMYISACNNATSSVTCKSNEDIKDFLAEAHVTVTDWEQTPLFSSNDHANLTKYGYKRET